MVLLLCTAGLLDAMAARSTNAGVVLVITRGASGDALNGLLRDGDARVVNVWARGRFVQLYVSSTQSAALPAHSIWASFRLPLRYFGWPGCG